MDTSKHQILNYINYYILQSDTEFFKWHKYTLIFWVEVLAIISSLIIFYLPILLQIVGYYFLKPSLTVSNIETMDAERVLINEYVNVKANYELVCTSSNLLGIKNKQTNVIMNALTLSGQTINNCSGLNLTI